MPDIGLTQQEADLLIQIEKRSIEAEMTYTFPAQGTGMGFPVFSIDGQEKFIVDVNRGRIDLKKVTSQLRARTNIPLVRLDLGKTARHRNPDGKEIIGPHIHIYREGHAMQFAEPIPTTTFTSPNDLNKTFFEFTSFCNITELPIIQGIAF